jgi:hypothetical protein
LVNGRLEIRWNFGRKSDAITLYQQRKTEARAGVKLAQKRHIQGVTMGELIDDALQFVADHKDARNYGFKPGIVRADLGDRIAASLTPQDVDQWLKEHCKNAATANPRC